MLRAVAGVVLVAGTLALSRKYEQVDLLRFALCWWGVVVALSGAVRLRHGAIGVNGSATVERAVRLAGELHVPLVGELDTSGADGMANPAHSVDDDPRPVPSSSRPSDR